LRLLKGVDLRDSDTGEKALGGGPKDLSETTLGGRVEGLRYLEGDKYPWVETVFNFKEIRGGRRE